MTTRILTKEEEGDLFELIEKIEQGISNKEWWLPIKEKERSIFFDKDKNLIMGLFDQDRLIGATMLTIDKDVFEEILAYWKGEKLNNVAKIGRCMISEEYRGRGYARVLNEAVMKEARKRNFKHVIAIAHPDNVVSGRALARIGMKVNTTFRNKDGYLRNLYFMQM